MRVDLSPLADPSPRTDLSVRAGLVVAAVVAVLASAPVALTVVLTALAVLAVGHATARRRSQGGVDAVLVGVGGVLVTLVVVGIVLGLTHVPLRASSWAIALGVVALAALALDLRRDAPAAAPNTLGRIRRRDLPWYVAALAVAAVAVGVSVHGVDRLDVDPIAMSVGPVDGTQVQVQLRSGRATGPLELRAEAGDGTSISYPLVTLQPDRPTSVTVQLPRRGRYVITLNNPRDDAPVRSLTVDR